MNKPKIIANYLPQYHQIPENDLWWGEGYTDWQAVKKAKPLYRNHQQPKIPLNNNYYDLADVESIRWQAETARKYGVDGFGIYHYWFSSELHLLDKPALLLKDHKDINIEYMFIWDNASWRRTWSNIKQYTNDWAPLTDTSKTNIDDDGILTKLDYGENKDWEIHFNYLLQFFQDERYIKVNNKPVFCFFNQYNNKDIIHKMVECWNELAIKNGFDGIFVIGKHEDGKEGFKYEFYYEPYQHIFSHESIIKKLFRKTKLGLSLYDYDKSWEAILNESNKNDNIYYTGIVGYDDSPRRGKKGRAIKNSNPEKFEKYISILYEVSVKKHKEFMFVVAWNEWSEGAYLEPDQLNGYSYLEALKNAKEKGF